MNASIVIAVIGSVLTVLSVTIGILTFYFSRKKDSSSDGEWRGELKSDLKHIREGVDELRHDTKEVKDDVQNLRERVVIVENSVKSAHHRIDDLQGKEREHVN